MPVFQISIIKVQVQDDDRNSFLSGGPFDSTSLDVFFLILTTI